MNKRIALILLLGSGVFLGSCEDLATQRWPGSPTILSESELTRNGFQFSGDEPIKPEPVEAPPPMDSFEDSLNWAGEGTKVRIIYGGLVGTDTSALKVGPTYKDNAEAILCLDFPVPECYNSIVLDARSRFNGLKISVAVGDYDGSTIYESAPVELASDWQRGLCFNLRQQDGWKLRGEEVYSRSFPNLPISSLRIIVSGETKNNAAVIDNIIFQ